MIPLVAMFLAWVSDREEAERLAGSVELEFVIVPADDELSELIKEGWDFLKDLDPELGLDAQSAQIDQVADEWMAQLGLRAMDPILVIGLIELELEDQRQGHGRRMVEEVELAAAQQGVRVSVLYSAGEAEGFWRRMGYEPLWELRRPFRGGAMYKLIGRSSPWLSAVIWTEPATHAGVLAQVLAEAGVDFNEPVQVAELRERAPQMQSRLEGVLDLIYKQAGWEKIERETWRLPDGSQLDDDSDVLFQVIWRMTQPSALMGQIDAWGIDLVVP